LTKRGYQRPCGAALEE